MDFSTAAVDLAQGQLGIDRRAAVVHGVVAADLDGAGPRVHRHLAEMRRVRDGVVVGRERGASHEVPFAVPRGAPVREGGVGEAAARPFEDAGVAIAQRSPAAPSGCAATMVQHLLRQRLGCLEHRVAREVRAAGGVGALVEGRGVGVTGEDRDVRPRRSTASPRRSLPAPCPGPCPGRRRRRAP